jgi:hypothetical protein
VPVSSVTAEIRFADDGVARNVATPVPRPDTPVEIGRPVALVRVPLDGVPRAPPLTTGEPAVPTFTARAVAMPVPRPETPVEIGSPVTFVITPDAGVPRAGADIDGLVRVLLVSVSVVALPTKVSVDVGNVSVPVLTILAITGVVRVGLVANTKEPVPVSSEMTPASSVEVVAAN